MKWWFIFLFFLFFLGNYKTTFLKNFKTGAKFLNFLDKFGEDDLGVALRLNYQSQAISWPGHCAHFRAATKLRTFLFSVSSARIMK